MTSQKEQGELHSLLENINGEEEEEDDMIEIQLLSSVIKVNFINLFTYSKLVRDEFQTLNVTKSKLSQKFQIFQKEFNISDNISKLFFSSFKNKSFTISNQNYGDLCKLSNFFQVKKLNKILKQYKDTHNFDADFIIREILKQVQNKASDDNNDEFSIEMESNLHGNVNSCLQNERFGLLPISIVYRVLSKSEIEISSDLLFDFISKSIEDRCTLFTFLDIKNLSDTKFGELIDLYDQHEICFQYLPTNLKFIKSIKDENKLLKSQLRENNNKNQEILDEACKFSCYIDQEDDILVSESISDLIRLSKKGNMLASTLIGFLQLMPPEDNPLPYLQKSLEQGNLYALCSIGSMYESSKRYKQNYSKAIEYYQQSAEKGNPVALLKLAKLYSEGKGFEKDYSKAIELLHQSASKGCSSALYYLGSIYEKGEGVERDYSKAIEYYNQSAEQGNPKAIEKLIQMYKKGDGVEQDYSKAIEYCKKLPNLGNLSPLNKLIDIYEEGEGVEQYYPTMIECFKQYGERENPTALNYLGKIYEEGKGAEQDYSKAIEYYKRSSELGDDDALDNLIEMYKKREGIEQYYPTIIEYFKHLGELGNSTALKFLIKIYKKGKGVEQDYSKVVEYCKQLCELGNSYALIKLRKLCKERKAPELDYSKLIEYFKQLVESGNSDALKHLGEIYEEGEGVEQNLEIALSYYEKYAKIPYSIDVEYKINRIKEELSKKDQNEEEGIEESIKIDISKLTSPFNFEFL